MTGEDLDYKPSTAEQAKFDYCPLSKFFNKGLKEEDKNEGLLKKLKNIEGKAKNAILLKDGLKGLMESYPSTFNTFWEMK